jgi:hypothetical protein
MERWMDWKFVRMHLLKFHGVQDPGYHRCWACIWTPLVPQILMWGAHFVGQDWWCTTGVSPSAWVSATSEGNRSEDWAPGSMELLSECRHLQLWVLSRFRFFSSSHNLYFVHTYSCLEQPASSPSLYTPLMSELIYWSISSHTALMHYSLCCWFLDRLGYWKLNALFSLYYHGCLFWCRKQQKYIC